MDTLISPSILFHYTEAPGNNSNKITLVHTLVCTHIHTHRHITRHTREKEKKPKYKKRKPQRNKCFTNTTTSSHQPRKSEGVDEGRKNTEGEGNSEMREKKISNYNDMLITARKR